MTTQPAPANNHTHRDDQHTPLLAMWYQTRTALADFGIPVLAGLKVVWLIAFSPTRFFQAYLDGDQELAALRSPFDALWRALTPEDREPLDAAKFLLFAILTGRLFGLQTRERGDSPPGPQVQGGGRLHLPSASAPSHS